MMGHEGESVNESVREAEKTLRMIAALPAPAGIEERVHNRLKNSQRSVVRWPGASARGGWSQSAWFRGAAAAAIVVVVAGGGWGIYSKTQPTAPQGIVLPRVGAPGGFSGANAVRTPKTLQGPVLHHESVKPKATEKKQKVAAKTQKPTAAQAAAPAAAPGK